MTSGAIELLIEPRKRPVGTGTVRRLLPWRRRQMVGPFVFADIMGPEDLGPGAGMDVDAHPHIGLATVTYLLAGRAVHRDSTGVVQTIESGAVNWMTAGAGVTHTERSHPDDRPVAVSLFGVQTWVALPDGAEDGQAGFEHCPAAEVPVDTRSGVTARLAVGSGFGLLSPVSGSSPLVLAELRVDGRGPIPADHPERAVLVLDGDIRIAGTAVGVGHLAVLEPGTSPEVSGSGTVMILGGEPVGARHIWWNFVHSDPERIEEAKQRWLDQRFPTVPGDHDPYVPLPT